VRRRRSWLAVALIAAYQFALALLSEGDVELQKHLFLFHACVDLQIGALLLATPVLFRRSTRIAQGAAVAGPLSR
jgi:hypothetical protein